jgi:cell division protease FtsH
MSDKVGPLTYGMQGEEIFLGRELGMQRTFSDDTARVIDAEVRRFIDEQAERARGLVTHHRAQLDSLAAGLLEHEVISGEEVDRLLGIAPAAPAPTEPAPAAGS